MHWYANPFDFVDFYIHTAMGFLEGDFPSTTHTIYNENIHHSMATNGGGTLCRRYAAAVVHLIVNQKNQLNSNINNTMPKKCPLEMWNMLFVSKQQCLNDKMFGFIISKPSCRPGKHMGKDVVYVHAHDAPLQVWRV